MDNTYFKKKKKYLRTTIFCIFSNLIAKNPCFKFLAVQRELRISTYLRIRIHIRNDFTDRKNKSDDAVKIFWWQKIREVEIRRYSLNGRISDFELPEQTTGLQISWTVVMKNHWLMAQTSKKSAIGHGAVRTPPQIAWPRRSWLYKQSEACTPVSSSPACNVQCNLSS